MSTKDILKKMGSWFLQFWIGQLIVVLQHQKVDPIIGNKHLKMSRKYQSKWHNFVILIIRFRCFMVGLYRNVKLQFIGQ